MLQKAVDGRVAVRVVPDGSEAYLQVFAATADGRQVSEDDVRGQLAVHGVSYGVDWQAVRRVVTAAGEGGSERIALARLPLRGRDATLELAPVLTAGSGQPRLREDGSVDYFDLGLARNVRAGEWLAKKSPATAGVPGISVRAEPMTALDGKDLPLPAGRGTAVSDDGLTLVAAVDGYPSQIEGRVVVSPVFRVPGDVDAGTGNVDFVGTVIVQGAIKPGFSVKAGADVEVHGGVEAGTVEAGGNVTVRYGILGSGRGQVQAGGSVRARFIENGAVRAGSDVRVSDGILHSAVQAGGRVLVDGRRGSIIGGQIRARDEVTARVLGSSLGVATEIAVGVRPELREELEQVRRELAEVEENLRRTSAAVAGLREQEAQGELPPPRKEALLKGLRAQYLLGSRRERLQERQAAIGEELRQVGKGRVRAEAYVFSGVRVTIGDALFVVEDVLQRGTFYLDDERRVAYGRH